MAIGKKTGGRVAGVPNKATGDFRDAVNRLLTHAMPHMITWLDRIAEDDAMKAMDTVAKLAEYAHPKLARSEHTGINGGPIKTETSLPESDKAILQHWQKTRGSSYAEPK